MRARRTTGESTDSPTAPTNEAPAATVSPTCRPETKDDPSVWHTGVAWTGNNINGRWYCWDCGWLGPRMEA
jgi:hypothetical protein